MTTVTLPCERGRSIELDTRHTALACIDFQVDFVEDAGRSGSVGLPVDRLQAAVPAAARALLAARRGGLFVFHTREAYAPDLSDLNPFRRRYDRVIGSQGPLGRFLIRGDKGTEIIDSLKPVDGEATVDKAGFSAFHGTNLDDMLRERGIETLLLSGVTTQCCVASTLRDAVGPRLRMRAASRRFGGIRPTRSRGDSPGHVQREPQLRVGQRLEAAR